VTLTKTIGKTKQKSGQKELVSNGDELPPEQFIMHHFSKTICLSRDNKNTYDNRANLWIEARKMDPYFSQFCHGSMSKP